MRRTSVIYFSCLFLGMAACKKMATPESHTQDTQSGAEKPLPKYEVAKATSALQIDGDLSEPSWKAAKPMRLQAPWTTKAAPLDEGTVVKMLWDSENLYVSYDNVDRDVHAHVTEQDGHVFEDDCNEIFVSPDAKDISGYVAFEVNARGVMLDYTTSKAGNGTTQGYDYPWSSEGVELKAALKNGSTLNNNADRDEGWTLEMKIPLKNFSSLAKNDLAANTTWRANLYRCKGHGNGDYYLWSPTYTEKPNFHQSKYFGHLIFR